MPKKNAALKYDSNCVMRSNIIISDLVVLNLSYRKVERAIILLPKQVVIIDPRVRSPFTRNVSVVVLPSNSQVGTIEWVRRARETDHWVNSHVRGSEVIKAKAWVERMSKLTYRDLQISLAKLTKKNHRKSK